MLATTYRPKTWAEFAGNADIAARIQSVLARPSFGHRGGEAFLLTGPSGAGKTTIANLAARQFAHDVAIEELDGDKCTVDAVRDLEKSIAISPLVGEWKVVIVNECHAMTGRAVQAFLTLLERLPPRRIVIFTTTETMLPFGDFCVPFRSRCRQFTLSPCDNADGARRLLDIASAEGIACRAAMACELMTRANGNLRDAITLLDNGDFAAPPAVRTARAA